MSKTIRYFFENFADCFRICGSQRVIWFGSFVMASEITKRHSKRYTLEENMISFLSLVTLLSE